MKFVNFYTIILFVRIIFSIFARTNINDMDAKLTLKLNKGIVEKAKEYASTNHQSLSKLVESYLHLLVIKKTNELNNKEITISPFVKSMSSGVHLPADLDYKTEYSNYLIEKYK
jgi:hypothetical protein